MNEHGIGRCMGFLCWKYYDNVSFYIRVPHKCDTEVDSARDLK